MGRAASAIALLFSMLTTSAARAEGPDGGWADFSLPSCLPSPAQGAGAPDAGTATAGDAGACPDLAILAAADQADLRLREADECDPEELARLAEAVKMFDSCAGKSSPAKSWVFPVANISPALAIGGAGGSGYVRNPGIKCFVSKGAGHPAHDLFVHDHRQSSRDKEGRRFPAVAVEDGYVLVARDGWQPGDELKGGNYVMLYLPGRQQIAYYA
ncbi:MAG: hypothetical protein HY901_08880, partial [Deltaproteobacteria bacterium]|nr:hypothetical protein [Deltaproteobacteria bacterium]